MASSAANNIQGSAHIHALHGRTHHKTAPDQASSGDKFADMLADADAAPNAKPAAPRTDSDAAKPVKAQAPQADAPQTVQADMTPQTALVAKPAHAADGAPLDETEDRATGAETKDGEAANDNLPSDLTPDLAQPLPQQTLTKLALEGGTAAMEDNSDAAPVQAAQPTAPDAAAPADAPLNTQDFKKTLHEAHAATAAPDAPPAARPADAETVKIADVAVNDFKPAAEILAAAPTGAPHAMRGVERPAMTGQADAPRPPTPDINQFAVDVAARSQSGAKQFDIRLDPPELGRVDVRLSIDAAGNAEAHLTADQPQTLDLLQKDASSLTRALRDAGLNVAQDGLNFSLKSQQGQSDGGQRQGHDGRPGFTGPKQDETRQPEAAAYVRRALGAVDIKV